MRDQRRTSISIGKDGSLFSIQRDVINKFNTSDLVWEPVNGLGHYRHIYAIDAFSEDNLYGITFFGEVVQWNGMEIVKVSNQRLRVNGISVGKDGSLWGYKNYNAPHRQWLTNIYEFDKGSMQWIKNSSMENILDLDVFTEKQIALVDRQGQAYLWDGDSEKVPLAKVDANGNKVCIYQIAIGNLQLEKDSIEPPMPSSKPNSSLYDDFESYHSRYLMEQLLIYPVPIRNKINIRLNKDIQNASIEIYSASGRLLYRKQNLTFRNGRHVIYNLDYLPSGIYFLKIRHKRGIISKLITKK